MQAMVQMFRRKIYPKERRSLHKASQLKSLEFIKHHQTDRRKNNSANIANIQFNDTNSFFYNDDNGFFLKSNSGKVKRSTD